MKQKLHKAIYTAVFFQPHCIIDAWKDKLVEQGMPQVPADGTLHCNHMTIQFKPDSEHVRKLPMGGSTEMQITGFAADDKCIAITVKYTRYGAESSNAIPHVTLWTAEGTKPVYSNELLSRGITEIENGPSLPGRTGFFSVLREKRFDYSDSIYGQDPLPLGI